MKNVFIILNYNDYENAKKLLEKVKVYKDIDKIIVVDNCSKDNSFMHLQQFSSNKIEIIKTSENKGYANGNNYGALYAIEKYNPQYLIIANPDIMFEEGIVNKIISILNLKKEYALGTVLVKKGFNIWNNFNYSEAIFSMFIITFNIKKMLIKCKLKRKKKYSEVEVAEGSFFVINASVFREIGGFDERTFLYYEENILALKLKRAGYRSVVLVNETYQHLHSTSIKKVYKSKAKAFINYKQSMSVYMKEYLKVNNIQFKIFEIFYQLALIERKICDGLVKIAT